MNDFLARYFAGAAQVLQELDQSAVERVVGLLHAARQVSGRLFIIGVGGSAANASHAVNDFRKICGIETYAPTDNVAELTARINDDGWDSSFAGWLRTSRLRAGDVVMVLSVGGGSSEKGISTNIVQAVKFAKTSGATVVGIVGRDGGYTAVAADAVVIVPTVSPDLITPYAESFQSLIWHAIVSHPLLKLSATKWESI